MSILLKKGRTDGRPNIYPGALVTALGVCLISVPAFAASHGDHGDHDHEEEKRHAESHEHGAAELAFALDGNQLAVEFISPGANIVGFEHEAKDADEIAAVEAAIDKLQRGGDLIEFEGAACTLSDADVEAEGLLEEAHEDEHHEDEHEGEDAHAEFEVKYTFNCTTPDQLSSISVSLFEQWPGIEEIETVFLSDNHQLSVELTAEKAAFEVK
ncbi:DUF2796 domain-containing protein [Parvibaculaceae bacterium PLY_AMNH_Bact1]|nr:DUF2796 domain-containing protein [Parvibaculaceae bacterium PLY_AMNH_Bact1]